MVTKLNTTWLLPSASAAWAIVFAMAGAWKWAAIAAMPLIAMIVWSGISILTERLIEKRRKCQI